MENKVDWKIIETEIRKLANEFQDKFEREILDLVFHFLNHDEYEIAFEILFTEIMKLENIPNPDYIRFKEIGLALKLNEETVYDPEFWNNFIRFIS